MCYDGHEQTRVQQWLPRLSNVGTVFGQTFKEEFLYQTACWWKKMAHGVALVESIGKRKGLFSKNELKNGIVDTVSIVGFLDRENAFDSAWSVPTLKTD